MVSATMDLRGLMAWDSNLLSKNLYTHLPSQLVEDLGNDKIDDYFLLRCAEIEILIPDPKEMALAVDSWGSVNERVFSTLYEIEKEMSITRGGRIEKITRDNNRDTSSEATEKLKQTSNSSTGGTDTTVQKVAGFNSVALVDSHSDSIKYGGTAEYSENNDNSKKNKENRQENETEKREIGVNSIDTLDYMQRNKMNMSCLYMIVEMFKEEFCLLVY